MTRVSSSEGVNVDQERREDSLWVNVWESFKFSLGVSSTIVYAVFPVFWEFLWYRDENMLTIFQRIEDGPFHFAEAEMSQNLTYIMPNGTYFWETADLSLVLPEVHQFFAFNCIFFFYFPISIVVYLVISWKQTTSILLSSVIGYIIYMYIGRKHRYTGLLTMSASMFPFLFSLCCIWLLVPSSGKIVRQASLQLLVYCLAVVFKNFFSVFAKNKLLMVFVIYPCVRELWYFLARTCARYLAIDAEIGGSNSKLQVRREVTWLFMVYIQIAIASYGRLLLTGLDGDVMFYVSMLYQAILEVLLRATLPWRDELLRRIMHERKRKKRTTFVVAPTMINAAASEVSSSASKQFIARSNAWSFFTTMVLTGEIVAEYVGIGVACGLLMIEYQNPIKKPYDYFAQRENFFEEGVQFSSLFVWGITQVVLEILVDTICCTLERRHGYDVIAVWQGKTKWFPLLLLFASWFGLTAVTQLRNFQNDYAACLGRDLCYCVGNGLAAHGLPEKYCMHIYPNTSGIPPGPGF